MEIARSGEDHSRKKEISSQERRGSLNTDEDSLKQRRHFNINRDERKLKGGRGTASLSVTKGDHATGLHLKQNGKGTGSKEKKKIQWGRAYRMVSSLS